MLTFNQGQHVLAFFLGMPFPQEDQSEFDKVGVFRF